MPEQPWFLHYPEGVPHEDHVQASLLHKGRGRIVIARYEGNGLPSRLHLEEILDCFLFHLLSLSCRYSPQANALND